MIIVDACILNYKVPADDEVAILNPSPAELAHTIEKAKRDKKRKIIVYLNRIKLDPASIAREMLNSDQDIEDDSIFEEVLLATLEREYDLISAVKREIEHLLKPAPRTRAEYDERWGLDKD